MHLEVGKIVNFILCMFILSQSKKKWRTAHPVLLPEFSGPGQFTWKVRTVGSLNLTLPGRGSARPEQKHKGLSISKPQSRGRRS